MLTVEAIAPRGLHLAGWVANNVDPAMLRQTQNVAALEECLAAPLLWQLPWCAGGDPQQGASSLRLPD